MSAEEYFIAHELAHAHEHYFVTSSFRAHCSSSLLSERSHISIRHCRSLLVGICSVLFQCSRSPGVWSAARKNISRDSARMRRKASFKQNGIGSMTEILSRSGTRSQAFFERLLKNLSYIMGHTAKSTTFSRGGKRRMAPDGGNNSLFPHFVELFAALAEMMNTFEEWKELKLYEPLKKVVRSVLTGLWHYHAADPKWFAVHLGCNITVNFRYEYCFCHAR